MNTSERFLFLNDKVKILQLIPNHSVPRYTSYPTTPNFNEKINSDIYESWLKKLDKNKKISLYIHIPFCNSLCYFCGCHTSATNIYDPIENYVKSLLREINILSEKLESKFNVSHIHFGGGQTESLVELPPGDYRLQLVLGDMTHTPHTPPVVSRQINITVKD